MHSVPIEVGLSDDAFDLLPDHYFPTQKQASKALKKDQRTQYALEKEGAIYFYNFLSQCLRIEPADGKAAGTEDRSLG